jgi:hypothetical protein
MFKNVVWRGMLRQRKLQKLCENCIGIFLDDTPVGKDELAGQWQLWAGEKFIIILETLGYETFMERECNVHTLKTITQIAS